MKPTKKDNVPIEVYHKQDGFISASRLKALLKSPLSFKYPPEAKGAKYYDIGHAVHTLILEPHLFEKDYFIYDPTKRPKPEQNFAQKDNKEWKSKLDKENEGKTVLTVEESEQCQLMVERLLADPLAKELLSGKGWNEASFYHMDWKRKVKLKSRPDRVRDNFVVVDIKTAIDASPKGFERAMGAFRYDIQAATQIDAVEAYFKKKVPYYFYIVLEKTPPYNFGIYVLKDETIWAGRQTYKMLLDIYNDCLKENEWPSYNYWAKEKPDKILRTQLPGYINTTLFQI